MLDRIRGQVAHGTYVQPTGRTLAQAVDDWLAGKRAAELRKGGLPAPLGNSRKPWSPRSVNYMLGLLVSILASEQKQGHIVRNIAALVDRIEANPALPDPLTETEVEQVLTHIAGDRYATAWELALASGLGFT